VTAYNSWESFVQQNEATSSSGGAASSATLFGDSTLREISLQLDSTVTSLVNNMSLADLGISLSNSNLMSVDSTTLSSQLSSNFSGVSSLFQSEVTTSSYTLQTSGTDYSSYSGNFTLNVTTDGSGNISELYLNGSNTPVSSDLFTVSGNKITGQGIYSGMSFTYSGTPGGSSGQLTVTATQGLANQLYTNSQNYGNTLNGTVETLVQDLQSQDSGLTTQYNTIINQANSYTTFLLQQYANLTTQIQSASYTSSVLQSFANQSSNS